MNKSLILPPKFDLTVPFHTQLNNDSDHDSGWWNECSYTTMAMFLRSFGFVGTGHGQFEDQIEKRFEEWRGIRGEPQKMSSFMNRYFPSKTHSYEFTYRATWPQLRKKIFSGHPVIVHTWLTESGHIILFKGWDDAAYSGSGAIIVHDPFGEWFPSGYDTNASGANLRYSYNLSKRLIGTDGDLWAHYGLPINLS